MILGGLPSDLECRYRRPSEYLFAVASTALPTEGFRPYIIETVIETEGLQAL